jgi:hypothetical protein
MKLGPKKSFLTFFGHVFEKKNFIFFSFVFELLNIGASRKKKKKKSKIDFYKSPGS